MGAEANGQTWECRVMSEPRIGGGEAMDVREMFNRGYKERGEDQHPCAACVQLS